MIWYLLPERVNFKVCIGCEYTNYGGPTLNNGLDQERVENDFMAQESYVFCSWIVRSIDVI